MRAVNVTTESKQRLGDTCRGCSLRYALRTLLPTCPHIDTDLSRLVLRSHCPTNTNKPTTLEHNSGEHSESCDAADSRSYCEDLARQQLPHVLTCPHGFRQCE